jgi:hypothetical protein
MTRLVQLHHGANPLRVATAPNALMTVSFLA